MQTLAQDLRYALRMLAKSPGFAAVAVLTLALGIGANTAIFTLVNALLLKSLPVQHPEQLVALGDPTAVHSAWHGTPTTDVFSYPLYRELRDSTSAFSGMAAAGSEDATVGDVNPAEYSGHKPWVRIVTGNYFSLLGVRPAAGRLFNANDDTAEYANPVAVISYDDWRNNYALSPSVIGTTLRLNGYPFTIIGVAQPGFFGDIVGDRINFYVPVTMEAEIIRGRDDYNDKGASWLQVFARLKPGVTVPQAYANANLALKHIIAGDFAASLVSTDIAELKTEHIDVAPIGGGFSRLRDEYQRPLLVVMGIVGLVLLIACVNVANLLLARASGRKKEIAVRLAIGAARGRIIRQLLTESILLAVLGGIAGAGLAIWGVVLLQKLFGSQLVTAPDVRVIGFAVAVSLLTGVLFGLVPALQSTQLGVAGTLKDAATSVGQSHSHWGWGKGLVTAQIALSLLVLFAAGLLTRTLSNLRNTDTGYEREHLLTIRVSPTQIGYKQPQIAALAERLQQRLAAMPGVRAVSFSSNGLFSGGDGAHDIDVPGFQTSEEDGKNVASDAVGPNYFSTVGIPILRGRQIGAEDTPSSTRVVVINQALAKHFFPNRDPLGQTFTLSNPLYHNQPFQIVGIAADAKEHSISTTPKRRMYEAFEQRTDERMSIIVEVRSIGKPSTVMASVKKEIHSIDPAVPIGRADTVNALIDDSIGERISISQLSGFFAILGLVLASIGLYGLMSYTVAGRTRELGVRMALGAQRDDVLWLVLRESLLLVGTGIVVGVPAALASGTLLSGMLYGLHTFDPVSLIAVATILGIVAALASYIPARRATRVDPVVALRYE